MTKIEKEGVAALLASVGWLIAGVGMIITVIHEFHGGPLTTEGWWWVAMCGFFMWNLGLSIAKVMGE